MRVVAATKNTTQPHGRRPYHSPHCFYVTKESTVKDNWTDYPSCAAAEADRRRPCGRCNPAD